MKEVPGDEPASEPEGFAAANPKKAWVMMAVMNQEPRVRSSIRVM